MSALFFMTALVGWAVTISPTAGAGAAGACGGKPRCTLQAHNVATEEAQHFRKIVKSVFGSVATVDTTS